MAISDYTLLDVYEDFNKNVQSIDKDLFISICEDFNMEVMREVIENGRAFNMGSYMSTIEIVKIDRNYSKPMINWDASHKYKQELLDEGKELYSKSNPTGHKWFVYFTDKWYCKFHWHKNKCKVKNKTVYRFTPTRGVKGNKTKLKNLLNSDSLVHLKYRKL